MFFRLHFESSDTEPPSFLGTLYHNTKSLFRGAENGTSTPFLSGTLLSTRSWQASSEVILFQIRLPRVLLAGLVGAALALSGSTLQGLFRNPMASPFVLGISAGASLGAVCAMVWETNLHFMGLRAVPLLAFVGAFGTTVLVYSVARIKGRVPIATLLLAGIAVGSFLSALVSLILVFNEENVFHIGFVGLIIPHTVRLLIGPDHRLLVPISALIGAAFLTAMDTVARTALASTEIPVGAITALFGGPFFLFLLRRQRLAFF